MISLFSRTWYKKELQVSFSRKQVQCSRNFFTSHHNKNGVQTLVNHLIKNPESNARASPKATSRVDLGRKTPMGAAVSKIVLVKGNSKVIPDNKAEFLGLRRKEMERVGLLWVKFYTVKYLYNTNPEISYEESMKFAESLLARMKTFPENSGRTFLECIGELSISATDKALDRVHSWIKDHLPLGRSQNYIMHLRNIFPDIESSVMDTTLLPNEKKGYLYDFPTLEDFEATLHPLFLVDSNNLKRFLENIHRDSSPPITLIKSKLEDLQKFGKLALEFNISSCIFSEYEAERWPGEASLFWKVNLDDVINGLTADSYIFKILDYRQSLLIEEQNKALNSKEIVFQYLGVLEFVNSKEENSINTWIKTLLNRLKGEKANEKGKKNIATSSDIIKKIRNYNIPPIWISDSVITGVFGKGRHVIVTLDLDRLESLGKKFLQLHFNELWLYGDWRKKGFLKRQLEELYFENIQYCIRKHIGTNINRPSIFLNSKLHFKPYHFVALYLLQDHERCTGLFYEILLILGITANRAMFLKKVSSLLSETGVLTFRLEEVPETSSSPLKLPKLLSDSRLMNLCLINGLLLRPQKFSRKYSSWKENKFLKNFILDLRDYGDSVYKFTLEFAMLSQLDEVSLFYFDSLKRTLHSNHFCKYLLDDSKVFQTLKQDEYENMLILNRYGKSLINYQFCQYISAVYISDPLEFRYWVTNIVSTFQTILANLNEVEAVDFFGLLSTKLKEHFFSLCAGYEDSLLQASNTSDIVRPPLATQPAHQDILKRMGSDFFNYVLCVAAINFGLESFINFRLDAKRLFHKLYEKAYRQETMLLSSLDLYYGIEVLQKGDLESRSALLDALPRIMQVPLEKTKAPEIPAFDITLNHHTTAEFFLWGSKIMLPRCQSETPLQVLLLVNYYISRTFLKMIKGHSKNINELPDLCTKFNTLGGFFYLYLVRKHVYLFICKGATSMNEDLISQVTSILLDRVFMSIVAYKSGILYSPFAHPAYQNLVQSTVASNFHFLRFSAQSFKQYIGFLCSTDINAADNWVKDLVDTMLMALEHSSEINRDSVLKILRSQMDHYHRHREV